MSGDSSIITGCRPSATGTQSDSRPSSRWLLGKHREAALALLDEEAGRAVRHLLERAGKRGADAADPIDLSFPSSFAPARSGVARRELPGPKPRDPLNQADGHRLGQRELERPLAPFVWRQLLGKRLESHWHRATGVRTLDEPNWSAADDALDLFRMDDD